MSCRKPKMLFESQAKADNFILYNKEEIEEENGKAPVRSYYCRLCGGWHVTSSQSEMTIARSESHDKQMAAEADRFAKIYENVNPAIEEVHRRWEEAKVAFLQGRLTVAELAMERCLNIWEPLRTSRSLKQKEWVRWTNRIDDLQRKINRFKEFITLPTEERESFLAKEDKAQIDEEICKVYLSYQTISMIESLFDEIEKDIQKGDKDVVRVKLRECKNLVDNHIQCPYKNNLIRDYKIRIKEM